MTHCLAAALLALTAVSHAACGQHRPPEARKALTIPPSPRDTVSPADLLPALRLVKRFDGSPSDRRFYRDAGLVYPCESGGPRDACVLQEGERLVEASRFALRARPEPEETNPPMIFSLSGPWPERAWMAELLGDINSNSVRYNVHLWTDAGWSQAIAFDLREGYRYVGAGDWTGGRIITPQIGIDLGPGKDPNGHPIVHFVKKPIFHVLSGPPSSDLPLLREDPHLHPRAFASLASGHAFLVYENGEHNDLVVHRWSPGDRQPVADEIPGVRGRFVSHDMSNESWWERDRSREILAVAPDEVYVAGEEKRADDGGRFTLAQFDGRAWRVSFIPAERRFVSFARAPDRSLWAVFSNDLDVEHPDGELWRKPSGGEFQRVELPPVRVDGVTAELSPFDVWPRGGDEVWIIARFGPRDSKEVPLDDKKYPHGLFLLKPSQLPAEPH